jgi:predicted class III extradiol MEMO1 family dioxygenase
MKNPRLSLIGMTHYTKQLILKNYICDEIDGQYMQTLSKLDSDNILQHIEKRDEQMSRSIHTLLNHSNNGRYFFAIGAGILEFI